MNEAYEDLIVVARKKIWAKKEKLTNDNAMDLVHRAYEKLIKGSIDIESFDDFIRLMKYTIPLVQVDRHRETYGRRNSKNDRALLIASTLDIEEDTIQVNTEYSNDVLEMIEVICNARIANIFFDQVIGKYNSEELSIKYNASCFMIWTEMSKARKKIKQSVKPDLNC